MYIPIWVIVIGALIIFLVYRSRKKTNGTNLINHSTNIDVANKNTNILKQESAVEIQKDFEEELEQTYTPKGFGDREIYIYKNLMRPWYKELSDKNHYNDKITQKITKDWIEYMRALKESATCLVLYKLNFEVDDEEKKNSFINDGRIARKKADEIEDFFASSIGKKAVDELSLIRNIDDEQLPQMILKQTLKKNSTKELINNK